MIYRLSLLQESLIGNAINFKYLTQIKEGGNGQVI